MTERDVFSFWWLLLMVPLLGWSEAEGASPSSRLTGVVAPDTLFLRIESFVRAGQGDSALTLVRPLIERAVAGGDAFLERNGRLYEASALCLLGRLREGEAASRRALALARSAGDVQRARMAMRWLGYSLLGQGRRAESTAQYRALRDEALAANDAREEAYARMGLAYFELQDGNWREAETGYRRAITLFARTGEGVMELEAMVGLARASALAGRYEDMRRIYLAILDRGGSSGARHVVSYTLNNLAVYESQAGDPARAMEYWVRAVNLLDQAGDLRAIVVPSLNLAAARLELGELDESERELEGLSKRCEQEGYLALQATVLNHLGAVRAAQGRTQAAEETWQGVLRSKNAPLDERAAAALNLASRLNAVARHAAALALLDARPRASGRVWHRCGGATCCWRGPRRSLVWIAMQVPCRRSWKRWRWHAKGASARLACAVCCCSPAWSRRLAHRTVRWATCGRPRDSGKNSVRCRAIPAGASSEARSAVKST